MTEGDKPEKGNEVPPLRYILTTDGLKEAFRRFAEQQRSEENLLFWWEVESYRNLKEEELSAKANDIAQVPFSFLFTLFIFSSIFSFLSSDHLFFDFLF